MSSSTIYNKIFAKYIKISNIELIRIERERAALVCGSYKIKPFKRAKIELNTESITNCSRAVSSLDSPRDMKTNGK